MECGCCATVYCAVFQFCSNLRFFTVLSCLLAVETEPIPINYPKVSSTNAHLRNLPTDPRQQLQPQPGQLDPSSSANACWVQSSLPDPVPLLPADPRQHPVCRPPPSHFTHQLDEHTATPTLFASNDQTQSFPMIRPVGHIPGSVFYSSKSFSASSGVSVPRTQASSAEVAANHGSPSRQPTTKVHHPRSNSETSSSDPQEILHAATSRPPVSSSQSPAPAVNIPPSSSSKKRFNLSTAPSGDTQSLSSNSPNFSEISSNDPMKVPETNQSNASLRAKEIGFITNDELKVFLE